MVHGNKLERMTVHCRHPLDFQKVRNVLVRGTNWIGDVIMTLPALHSIRKSLPQAHIAVLAKPWVEDVFHCCPDVDEVIVYRSPGEHEGFAGIRKLARELRARRFDCAVLLQNAIEAAIIARLAGIPVRAGYNSDARGWLLTHSVQRTKEIRRVHQSFYYLEMLKSLGFMDVGKDEPLHFGEALKKPVPQLLDRFGLDQRQIMVGMAPGAAYGPAKRWPAERFAEVARRLIETYDARIVLFGSGADRAITDRIQAVAGPKAVNIAGETGLKEAMALIAQCGLFISNDSGLMHVAGALDIPTIAIFGSTNPITTSPPGECCVIIRKPLPCSPCLKKKCAADFRCMTLIEASEVYAAAREMLESKN
jgi:heptosyltransferase-2